MKENNPNLSYNSDIIYFSYSLKICGREQLLCELKRINSLIGIARGSLHLADHMDRLAANCIKNENGGR